MEPPRSRTLPDNLSDPPAVRTPLPAIHTNGASLTFAASGTAETAPYQGASQEPDTASHRAPTMRRGETIAEMPAGYQQAGKIALDGDTITQQLGRGKTVEYSMTQLAGHSNDPAYFAATMRYSAERGDSVNINYAKGTTSVHDPALEQRLPQDIPLRDPILRASVMHDIDPMLLAAVGVQETKLGANYLGRSEPAYDMKTHRGDRDTDSPGGHGYGPFQYDDQHRHGKPGRPQAELDRVAGDPYYAADKAAGMLADNLARTNGDVKKALHLYNAPSLKAHTTKTNWGPEIGAIPYEDSTMRFYEKIQERVAQERKGVTR